MEGLESGAFDEEVCVKTKEEKKEQKEKIDTLLTSLKSPTHKSPTMAISVVSTSITPASPTGSLHNTTTVIKSESNETVAPVTSPKQTNTSAIDSNTILHSPRGGVTSPRCDTLTAPCHTPHHTPHDAQTNSTTSPVNPTTLPKSLNMKWFSLKPKGCCEEVRHSTPVPPAHIPPRNVPMIRPPNFKQLGDDRQFLETIYSCYSQTSDGSGLTNHNSLTPFRMSSSKLQGQSLLGLPPEIDINLLIQQDPQKAAELLEIQLVVPQDIPEEIRNGWWRITDPELMQKLNKCAHPRHAVIFLSLVYSRCQ